VTRHPARSICLRLLVVALAAAACGGGGDNATAISDRDATIAALSTQVAADATEPAAPTARPSRTPVPTEPGAAVTAELSAAATQAAEQATQLAVQGTAQAEQAATATAIAPITAELAGYGVDPAEGSLAFIHPPLVLDAAGFRGYSYANENIATVARDFVVSTTITWNTRFGDSGCGLVLRTDGNDEAVNQYVVVMTRAANGHVYFAPMAAGEVIQPEIVDMYARGIDPVFTSANDTTNKLAVVARGSTFTVFTNGTQVGQLDNTRYERGFVAMTALNNSGETHCEFNNTWLWLLN
jgi:hypothetical protein